MEGISNQLNISSIEKKLNEGSVKELILRFLLQWKEILRRIICIKIQRISGYFSSIAEELRWR